MFLIPWLWAIAATVWAICVTIMLFRNPLPFPDKGHRAYGLASEEAREIVVKVLRQVGNLKARFTFDSGPTHQTLMWDGFTVLNYVDENVSREHSPNGLSLAVKDPRRAAELAVDMLKKSGYTAGLTELTDETLPPNHLVLVDSNAFTEWVLVFRRQLIKMPRPKLRERIAASV